MATALESIAEERKRQVEVEGWTHEHDDAHEHGELAFAAAAYATHAARPQGQMDVSVNCYGQRSNVGWFSISRMLWPFHQEWFKCGPDARRELVKAGALIVAEIERLDRLADLDAEGGAE
jgi:hypothetical protein